MYRRPNLEPFRVTLRRKLTLYEYVIPQDFGGGVAVQYSGVGTSVLWSLPCAVAILVVDHDNPPRISPAPAVRAAEEEVPFEAYGTVQTKKERKKEHEVLAPVR